MMPRKRRAAPKAPSFDQLRKLWCAQKAQKAAIVAQRDLYGGPQEYSGRSASGPQVIAALQAMSRASGNPAYHLALIAIFVDGFDRLDAGTLKRARARRLGGTDEDVTIYPHMERLLLKEAKSVRRAAARVAAMWGAPGNSFEAAIKTLEIGYRSRGATGPAKVEKKVRR